MVWHEDTFTVKSSSYENAWKYGISQVKKKKGTGFGKVLNHFPRFCYLDTNRLSPQDHWSYFNCRTETLSGELATYLSHLGKAKRVERGACVLTCSWANRS